MLSATLEELTFKHHCAACCKNILKKVFDYAFTHSVEELNVYIDNCRDGNWPVSLDSSESSTSLNLECVRHMSFRFLGLRSGSFKNLTDLELDGATITDLEAFLGFPELKRLILFNCDIDTEGEILRVNAPNLATLIISTSFHESFNCCELTTPNLKIFCYEGIEFPRIQTHEALPVLETLCISLLGMDYGTMDHMKEKRKFDDLFSMFCEFHNAKYVLLLSPVIALLYLYEDELVKRCPPFRKLKNLMLDFKGCKVWSSTICSRIASNLKGYFLQNSPDAKFTMINSDVDELQGNKLFADLLETSFSPLRK